MLNKQVNITTMGFSSYVQRSDIEWWDNDKSQRLLSTYFVQLIFPEKVGAVISPIL